MLPGAGGGGVQSESVMGTYFAPFHFLQTSVALAGHGQEKELVPPSGWSRSWQFVIFAKSSGGSTPPEREFVLM